MEEAARPPAIVNRPHRRIASIFFLGFGLLVAGYLGTQGPKDQHVRIVLGAAALNITSVDLRYISKDGEVARSAQFTYPDGSAPRVIAHDPQLPNGDYLIEIDADLANPSKLAVSGQKAVEIDGGPSHAREGRRAIQRRVTLGGGSTQIDVSTALAKPAGQ